MTNPLVLEIMAFTFQSIGVIVSIAVFLLHFRELSSYDGHLVRRCLWKIMAYTFLPWVSEKPKIDEHAMKQVILATKATNQLCATLICVYILSLRIIYVSLPQTWSGIPSPLRTCFLVFHIALGIWAISTSVNVWVYFYSQRAGR